MNSHNFSLFKIYLYEFLEKTQLSNIEFFEKTQPFTHLFQKTQHFNISKFTTFGINQDCYY